MSYDVLECANYYVTELHAYDFLIKKALFVPDSVISILYKIPRLSFELVIYSPNNRVLFTCVG